MSQMSISSVRARKSFDVNLVDQYSQEAKTSEFSRVAKDTDFSYLCKRIMDVTIVILGIPVLTPLLLLIALCIKLDSAGPVFFRQKRVGAKRVVKNGVPSWEIATFEIFKFRSMYVNADETLHQEHVRAWINGELEEESDSKAKTKLSNDPRITPMGHLLRKTSLDEVPQLINIFLGEMSIVGPRPVPEYEVAEYEPEHYERLQVLPGLTGLWQVEGRGNVSFEEMMELDIKYVRTRSIWQDIKIIVLTIPAVLLGRGAK